MNPNLITKIFRSSIILVIKSDLQTFRMRALWIMMRFPDENSPLITLVIMSITYYKMVGMAILQNGFIQNGIVKMVKMENGQLS